MKKTHIIALVILAVAFAIIVSMIGDYSSYEPFSTALKNEGQVYHVAGTYQKEKGMEYNPEQDADLFSFYMTDRDGNECKVVCNDDKPQDFELAEELVVIGKMKNGVFYASELLTKCPSKYTDEEIEVRKENPAG